MNKVIKVVNISKVYRIGIKESQPETILSQVFNFINFPLKNFDRLYDLNNYKNDTESLYWALKNISFEVNEGEVLGIIGKNGAGKSTLLKILSQIVEPTSGKIEIQGRVASLLEVGTGFHPELSGRDNIYMNGTILGMSKNEVDRKLEEIIDFSGIEKFIDTPVKFYSSGMKVRLGFSVAAHLEPEILIIDEVLAVGDYEFQNKCLGKMEDVSKNQGRTVIFVSHDMNSVKRLCEKAVVLKGGETEYLGHVNHSIDKYLKKEVNEVVRWNGSESYDNIKITRTEVFTEPENSFYINSDLIIELEIEFFRSYQNLVIGFNIISEFGSEIARANYNDFIDDKSIKEGRYIFKFKIKKYILAVGKYNLCFDIAIPFVSKINTKNIDLSFSLLAKSPIGNEFNLLNSREYNSQIRMDWFVERIKL